MMRRGWLAAATWRERYASRRRDFVSGRLPSSFIFAFAVDVDDATAKTKRRYQTDRPLTTT